MKITKEEIRNEASRISKGIFTSTNAAADFETGFAEGADWMYQQLEPLITDLSMDKARRQSEDTNITQSEVMTLEAIKEDHAKELGYSDFGELFSECAYTGIDVFVDLIAEKYASQFSNALKQCQSDRDEAEQKIGKLANVDLPKWIDASKRLPDDPSQSYMIMMYNKNKEGGIPIIDMAGWDGENWNHCDSWETVIKWMPLDYFYQALQSTEPKEGGQGE